jgi:hypothetical protein
MNIVVSCSCRVGLRLGLRLLGRKVMMQLGAMGMNCLICMIDEFRKGFRKAADITLRVACLDECQTGMDRHRVVIR